MHKFSEVIGGVLSDAAVMVREKLEAARKELAEVRLDHGRAALLAEIDTAEAPRRDELRGRLVALEARVFDLTAALEMAAPRSLLPDGSPSILDRSHVTRAVAEGNRCELDAAVILREGRQRGAELRARPAATVADTGDSAV